MRTKPDCINRLQAAGISYDDAVALRRISMTLHRWHELECGDSNDHYSFALVRGRKSQPFDKAIGARVEQFEHDDNGTPFIERHANRPSPNGKYRTYWTPIPDRERGALKRLAAIMARYPGFAYYVQGDPRGCALYIMTPGQMASREPGWLSANYSCGIAVHK